MLFVNVSRVWTHERREELEADARGEWVVLVEGGAVLCVARAGGCAAFDAAADAKVMDLEDGVTEWWPRGS